MCQQTGYGVKTILRDTADYLNDEQKQMLWSHR
jgi:hypothetical protein